MKNIIVFAFCLLSLFSLPAASFGQETIRLTNGEWPPLLSKNLEHYGVASRIVTDAFALAGVRVEYGFFPWKRSYDQAKAGRWDGSVVWGHKPERDNYFYYSDAVWEGEYVFFYLKKNRFDWKTVDDLQGVPIGGTLEYTYGEKFYAAEKAGTIDVQWVIKDELNFKKLLKEKITLFPQFRNVGYYQLHSRPLTALTSAAKTIDLDNLENIRIDIKASGKNELKSLEESFNAMINKLQVSKKSLLANNEKLESEIRERKQVEEELVRYKENLEEQIRKRTLQLSESNEQLRREIEERKRTGERLEQAKEQAEIATRAKTLFLTNMSHEIRTPLNSIVGFSQVLLKGCKKSSLPSNFGRFLENIKVSGENLSELINNILDLSKIESGKASLSEENINLKLLVQGIYHINKGQAMQKGVNFTYTFDPDVPDIIRTDRTKVNQILMNLVSNAIKFTPENKSVKLEVSRRGVSILFRVEDQGIGIATAHHDSIFEAFEQADQSTTKRFGGTGLGLAIVKKMTELLGGSIELKSSLGEGAVFQFSSPLLSARSRQAQR